MEKNQIIDIEAQVVNENPSEAFLKEIEALNKATGEGKGEWINITGHGLCWKPVGDQMGQPMGVPSPSTPPPAIEKIVQWGDTIVDLDNVPQNSIVMIKLNVADPMRANMMQRAIAKQVLEPRIEKLKEKRVCILFMQAGDDISVMTEEEMNKAGWEKKEKSRIIIPGQ